MSESNSNDDGRGQGGVPPKVAVQHLRRSLLERISIIWVIPILALAIAIGAAWKHFEDLGPMIEVTFPSAEGIEEGKTQLRYRDMVVGTVEKMNFTQNLQKVKVSIRIDPDVAPYIDKDAKFWVVRPEVTAKGITGLTTVLTGVYIEGRWDDNPGGLHIGFDGLDSPPLNQQGKPGLHIRLRAAPEKGLTSNATIEYRGIEVGQLGTAQVMPDGDIEADAIIYAPNDKLVTSATRFWDKSGVSFNLGPSGVSLNVSSLSTLVSGGVTFNNVVSGGKPVEDGHVFTLYGDEDSARASLYSDSAGGSLTFDAYFDQNLAGLSPGAAVTYGGLQVGEVSAISGIVDQKIFGDDDVHLKATFSVQPSRLGVKGAKDLSDVLDYLQGQVENGGLRARLATASIFTGGLKVDLVPGAGTAPKSIDETAQPNPIFPTAQANVSDVSASVEGMMKQVSSLPIDQLMKSAINALDSVSTLLGNPQTQAVPGQVSSLLSDAQNVMGSDAVQGLPQQLSDIAGGIDNLVQALNQANAAQQLLDAVNNVSTAADAVNSAVAGVPGLVDTIDQVAKSAQDVPLDKLAAQLDKLIASANGILSTDGAQALPQSLSTALNQLSEVLAQLRNGGLIDNANETMASARDAADNVSKAADDLPGLLENAQKVLDQANTTLQGYDARNGVGRNLDQTLSEVQRAASAITSLARELQRNPNALLFGK